MLRCGSWRPDRLLIARIRKHLVLGSNLSVGSTPSFVLRKTCYPSGSTILGSFRWCEDQLTDEDLPTEREPAFGADLPKRPGRAACLRGAANGREDLPSSS